LQKIGIIGAGKVGMTFGMSLQKRGYRLVGVCCQNEESNYQASKVMDAPVLPPEEIARRSEVVFLTTPDGVIEGVCKKIARQKGFGDGKVVIHTSGAHSSSLLYSARELGALALSMHPLQTFPSVSAGIQNLPGSYFALEGDEEAVNVGHTLVKALEGIAVTISTELKPLYHASACVVCNYFVSLMEVGLQMMERAGVSREHALQAMLPLVKGTVANLEKVGVPEALTGPIDRGDHSTVSRHLEIMEKELPQLSALYRILGRHTVEAAKKKASLTEEEAEEIIKVLET